MMNAAEAKKISDPKQEKMYLQAYGYVCRTLEKAIRSGNKNIEIDIKCEYSILCKIARTLQDLGYEVAIFNFALYISWQ